MQPETSCENICSHEASRLDHEGEVDSHDDQHESIRQERLKGIQSATSQVMGRNKGGDKASSAKVRLTTGRLEQDLLDACSHFLLAFAAPVAI